MLAIPAFQVDKLLLGLFGMMLLIIIYLVYLLLGLIDNATNKNIFSIPATGSDWYDATDDNIHFYP